MIDGEVLKGERDAAAVTDSLLFSKECVLMSLVTVVACQRLYVWECLRGG